MAVDWGGGLPKEILQSILECLPVFYHPCFASVCVSWHSAVKERPVKPSLPWLAYQTLEGKGEVAMVDFLGAFGREAGLSCRARHPRSGLSNFHGSSVDGHWVINQIYSHDVTPFSYHVTANNLVTGATIHFPRWQSPASSTLVPVVFTEATSLMGASHGGLLAVAIVLYKGWDGLRLLFARAGDDECTELETAQETDCCNIAFCDGKIYAAASGGNVLIFDLKGPSPMVIQTRARGAVLGAMIGGLCYWVHSSSGELLLLWVSYGDNARSFGVVRLDMGAGAQWVEVKSLGQDAILFDEEQAICISTEGMPELTRSCIYFPKGVEDVVHLGIFNLENGKLEYHPLSDRPPCGKYAWKMFWYIPALV